VYQDYTLLHSSAYLNIKILLRANDTLRFHLWSCDCRTIWV